MALCRGLNAGYGSVGLLEPRIDQVGENSPLVYRQRSLVSDTRVVIEVFSKAASGGRPIGLRRERIYSVPHGSFCPPFTAPFEDSTEWLPIAFSSFS
jgi:hypothetical protein